jgi:hypothetical protein
MNRFWPMSSVIAFAVLALAASSPAPRALAPISVHDVDGRAWSLLTPAPGHADLVIFIATDCPISNRYAPEIVRIAHEYAARGVRAFLVFADAATKVADVKTHAREFGESGITAIVDTNHLLVNATGATVTPEAAVYASTGLVYSGRIDDLYVDIGKMRPAATRHDVRLALDAALSGKPMTIPSTTAIGCYISK